MKKILCIASMAVTAVLAVVSYCVLPASVVTQIGPGGATNAMPKLAALALSLLLAFGGGLAGLMARDPRNTFKGTAVSVAGAVVLTAVLLVNLPR
ncbi:MAG: hypothetical protein Q4C53_07945 [Clostridia bacterium]|nr:hypothetical protein [Clostridia bacterium]